MSSTYLGLYYHLVFSTKNREPFIQQEWRSQLHGYLIGTVVGLEGRTLGVGGMADHVHLLVELKATHRLADFMRDLKKASSSWVHQTIPLAAFGWQDGYAALTVSASSLATVQRYVEKQEEHHRHRSFREEVLTLLRRAGIEVDERYFD
jgi:putative transposase